MSIIAIYQTDAWHSSGSMELIAIATTVSQRDRLVRKFLKENLEKKPSRKTLDTALEEIKEWGQTQCLSEEYDLEVYTETLETNAIL